MTRKNAKSDQAEPLAKTVGRNLERLRTKHGLRKAELAERSGLHRVTVSQIEAVRYKSVSFDSVRRLAEALGEPIDEFFAATGSGVANAR